MELDFSGPVWEWRGPAPFHFVTVPAEQAEQVAEVAGAVSYGWGMVPGRLRIGGTDFATSLWPKDGGYVVPLKDAVRRAEGIELGDMVHIRLVLDL
ncbi:DUF1905 domain-containing protein [Luteococcus peritonei]|uniref:DUF1905 domain-containing protein n=1 Tax=Luteococcus peritonei TaxID=88874 RepID=A0ABW4RTU7_9ACTN